MAETNKDVKVTLYWLDQSRSHRILWLLEELNVPYELKIFKRGADMLAPEELKKVHALGKSPVVTIEAPGASQPLVLAESGLIVEYLCDHFGGEKLIPTRYVEGKEGQVGGETEAWMRYRYYMHFSEGSLMPFLVMKLVMDTVKNAPVPFFIKFIPRVVAGQVEARFLNKNLFGTFDFLENQLKTSPGGGPYFCGPQVTAADIMMSFPLIAANTRMPLKEKYPLLAGYVEKIQQEAGYKRAVAKIEQMDGKFKASM